MSKSNEHPILVTLKKMSEKYDKAREMKSLVQPRNACESVGPGYYKSESSQFKGEPSEIRGPRWELSKEERFKVDEKELPTEEYDQIIVDKIRR